MFAESTLTRHVCLQVCGQVEIWGDGESVVVDKEPFAGKIHAVTPETSSTLTDSLRLLADVCPGSWQPRHAADIFHIFLIRMLEMGTGKIYTTL